MKKIKPFQIILSVFFAFSMISNAQQSSLKQIFLDDFMIGVAINKSQIKESNSKEKDLIKMEFSTITAENIMKWEEIHPKPNKYKFNLTDKLIELAKRNKQSIIGHALVWHNQIPNWVTRNKNGNLNTKEILFKNIEDHISNVGERYRGKVYGWDVINEAFNEDGTFRDSDFFKISGEEYIFKSFEIASKNDPEAELYYNDYSLYKEKKIDAVINLANRIKSKGLRIDGIGLQAHWGLDYPTIEEVERSILKISNAGLKVHFSELDIDVLPNLWEIEGADLSDNFKSNKELNPYIKNLPDSISNLLSKRYEEIFKLFYKHRDKIERVTFWGLSDKYSWKNDWPAKGRTNHPLLFDRNLSPKKAYRSVVNWRKNIN